VRTASTSYSVLSPRSRKPGAALALILISMSLCGALVLAPAAHAAQVTLSTNQGGSCTFNSLIYQQSATLFVRTLVYGVRTNCFPARAIAGCRADATLYDEYGYRLDEANGNDPPGFYPHGSGNEGYQVVGTYEFAVRDAEYQVVGGAGASRSRRPSRYANASLAVGRNGTFRHSLPRVPEMQHRSTHIGGHRPR
jgi:hypothetical protein